MSTKIYNAYQYNGTIHELFKYLQKVKKERMAFWESGIQPDFKYAKFEELYKNNSYDIDNLYSESVVIYPHKNKIFVQLFVHNDLRKKICRNKKFVDFHYQDQADKPDHITNADWNVRKRIWDRIMSECAGVPKEIGLTYEFMSFSLFKNIALAYVWKRADAKAAATNNKLFI